MSKFEMHLTGAFALYAYALIVISTMMGFSVIYALAIEGIKHLISRGQ